MFAAIAQMNLKVISINDVDLHISPLVTWPAASLYTASQLFVCE